MNNTELVAQYKTIQLLLESAKPLIKSAYVLTLPVKSDMGGQLVDIDDAIYWMIEELKEIILLHD